MNVADALSGRMGLPGVQWLLLAAAPRKSLGQELAALLPDGGQVAQCRILRASFKPGRRLTAWCDVELRGITGRAAGNMRRPIAVTWAADFERERQGAGGGADEMVAEALRRGVCAPFRQLLAEIPDWGMRILVSPLDTQFPQLVRLSDPEYIRQMLASVDGDGMRAPGGAQTALGQLSDCTIEPIRYRPGQRHVLRYGLLQGTEPQTVFAKLYRGNHGERAFGIANQLSAWLGAHGNGIVAVKPLAYLAAEGVILYPCVSGKPLSRYLSRHLSRSGASVAGYLQLAGQALRLVHCAPQALADAVEHHSFEDDVRAILRAGQHLDAVGPQLGAAAAAIVDRARAVHQRLGQEPAAFAHGDFKADHLWIAGRGLTLIDFDSCRRADPAADIGKFLADLRWWYGAYGLPGLEQAQAQFLAGYAPGAAPDRERMARARVYEALALVKIAIRRVRLFERDWTARTQSLLATAESLLATADRLLAGGRSAGGLAVAGRSISEGVYP